MKVPFYEMSNDEVIKMSAENHDAMPKANTLKTVEQHSKDNMKLKEANLILAAEISKLLIGHNQLESVKSERDIEN